MTAFIDAHRDRFGVEPICRTLGVSASAYYHRASAEPCARAQEDERLLGRIREVHEANYEAYVTGGHGRRCSGPASGCRAARCSG